MFDLVVARARSSDAESGRRGDDGEKAEAAAEEGAATHGGEGVELRPEVEAQDAEGRGTEGERWYHSGPTVAQGDLEPLAWACQSIIRWSENKLPAVHSVRMMHISKEFKRGSFTIRFLFPTSIISPSSHCIA